LIGLGLIGGLGYLCFLRAMVVAPVSIVTAIVSGYSVVILLWAIVVLGETPGLSQGYGTALTLVGIALACVGLSDLRGATRQGSGLLLSACATLTLGTWIFAIEYYGKSVGVLLALFVGRLTATLLLLGLIAVRLRARRGARPRLLLSALPLVVAAGLLDTFGYLFFQFGAQHSQTAVVAVASSVYFLVPVALAIWLLRERPARKQLLGFALIALGLLLLASPG
jgi:drug/metabolite transporter (DMT)-like permease